MGIKENVERIKEEIRKSCERVGRKPEEVKLLAASKTRSPDEIREAFRAGIKLFGENRVQEAREKIPQLKDLPIEWHLIGHLQTNKVKYAVELFNVIETVDRKKLVDELVKRLKEENLEIFVEVKLSPEETKHGCSQEDLFSLVEYILQFKNLKLKGLMTVPPYFENPEEVRPFFRKLRELRDKLEKEFKIELPELSMGMSHDFKVAIEEGATIVRIGTAIFGERRYR